MAKKSKKKKDDKKGKKPDPKQRKADAKRLKAERKAEKSAKALKKKGAAKQPEKPAPDQVELLKLALRSTEAKLVDAEHRLRQVQQQLDDERRALAEASAPVDGPLEEAVVDAAVEATVAEIVIDTEYEVATSGAVVSDAELVEAVAEQLEETAAEVDPEPVVPDQDSTSSGDAAAAAEVFEDAGLVDAPPATDEELTPPLPVTPGPGEPNAGWTLLKLREEAKRRGLSGTSSLPKAALLERLQQG